MINDFGNIWGKLTLLLILCRMPAILYSQPNTLDIQYFSVKDGLSSPSVNAMYRDSQGFMWIATVNGLNRFDGHGFSVFNTENSGLQSNNITDIREDDNQKLWLLHSNVNGSDTSQLSNIDIFDLQTYQIQNFDKAYGNLTEAISDDFVFLYSDRKKGIWIVTAVGIIYHFQNEKINLFYQTKRKSPIQILHVDEKIVWLSDKLNILKIDRFNKEVEEFHFENVFEKVNIEQSSSLTLLQPDEKKLLQLKSTEENWQTIDLRSSPTPDFFFENNHLSTNRFFDPIDSSIWYFKCGESDYSFVYHPSEDTLINFQPEIDRFFASATPKLNDVFFDEDGRIWIATEQGFLIASLKRKKELLDMKNDLLTFPLRITSCKVLNRKTGVISDRTSKIVNKGSIFLSPLDGSFEMELAILNYDKTYLNTFSYKIEGLDDRWINIPDNSFRINDLPYGEYVLHIKGKDGSGQWASNELTLPVTMFRPFFMTKWFLVFVILALVLIVYLIFQSRLRRLKHAKITLQETVNQRTEEIIRQKDEIEHQAKKLNELDQLKSRFFANLSHELRTPLTLILGHLDILKQEHSDEMNDHAQASLDISKQNSQRLLELVEEILDLSKLEAGQLKLSERTVVLYDLVHQYFDMFRSFASQKQIEFSLDYKLPKQLVINLDQNKFEKILTNLLSNAVKYTDDGGQIQLSVDEAASISSDAKQTQSYLSVQVIDTGRGIHADDLPKIFDRFYQSAQPNIVAEGGAGLGLSFAKELTDLMGGTLSVQSELGTGSSFILVLPKEEATILSSNEYSELDEKHETANLSTKALEPEKKVLENDQEVSSIEAQQVPVILIVEDHDQMRDFIHQVIAPHYQILEASNGLEALIKLEKHKIDLVISDVMMPRMDGFQLLKEIKEKERFGDLPIVMLTARAAQEDKLHALTIGVDDYLNKPFNPQELLARLKNLLKNQLERKQLKDTQLDQELEDFVPLDQQFIQKAEALVRGEMGNSQLSVKQVAEVLCVSEIQLFRKLKSFTGLTPVKFIREIRLQEARKLLEGRKQETISEVMYAVGFRQTGYFAKRYHERFGKLPSEYFD